jgi:hypothetical protein
LGLLLFSFVEVVFKSVCNVHHRATVRCVACPKSTSASVGAMLGIAVTLLAVALLVFRIRTVLPVGVIKLGVSMFQIVASGSTSYAIPWYDAFLARTQAC